jgi:ring-1,2-phenylacetyl-CoA epoxidase subunit PaaC
MDAVFKKAQLSMPDAPISIEGGRDGLHTESFGYLLAELQYMQRSYPGLAW